MADPVRNLKSATFDHEPSDSFNSEIATLRSEVASLREMLSEKTSEAYDKVAEKASNAASYVQSEASTVAGTIREHPAASTTLFTLIGTIGFALGYIVATSAADTKQAWYQRYLNDRF